jgi:hypothetical protein
LGPIPDSAHIVTDVNVSRRLNTTEDAIHQFSPPFSPSPLTCQREKEKEQKSTPFTFPRENHKAYR